MDVLIRGSGFVNKGAEALVRTAQAELRRRLGDVRYHVVPRSVEPRTDALVATAGLNVLDPRFTRHQHVVRTLRQMLIDPRRARTVYATRAEWLRTAAAIEHVDAVIDVSGYAYGDPWGPRYAADTHRCVTFARAATKPYVFLPQAWGPFERAGTRGQYRETCAQAALLFARDQVSGAHVAGLLGRSAEEVEVRPDIAFRFRGEAPETGRACLDGLGIARNGQPLAGVAPNRQMYKRTPGTGLKNQYIRTLVDMCQILRQLGAAVVLIPHEIEPHDNGTTDDRLLCSMVESGVGDPRCVAMTERCDSGRLKSVIGHLDLLVGSRFHALVAALSCRVPVVALGWSHKYVELLRPFGMDAHVVNHEELSGADLRALVTRVFNARAAWRDRLEERVPAVEQAVDETFDRVADALLATRG